MSEAIYKLQPHRTMHLQGFGAYGANAALWGASSTGFSLSGVFRDQGDFAVLVLFDRDDAFGHPRFSYLPDGDFTGISLAFDIQWQGVQAFESKKAPFVDWPYLNCLKTDGTVVQKRLTELATGPGGRTGASRVFTLNGTPANGDRATLWYQNQAFDIWVTSHSSTTQAMWWQGNATYNHSVTVGGRTYSVPEDGLGSSAIASNIAGQIAAGDPNCTASASGNTITVALRAGIAGPVGVSSSDGSGPDTLTGSPTPAQACQNIANQINAVNWTLNGPVVLSAVASGNQVTVTAEPGADGNMVTFYETHSGGISWSGAGRLAGGSSDNVAWHVAVDFSALGLTDIQRLWLTLAPALANSAAYVDTEWQVTVTNWTVTDSAGKRALKVAGPGSVRIEEDSSWVVRSGYWENAPADGFAFWSQGRAIRAAAAGAAVTVETHCQAVHNIYIGTRFDFDCGILEARLDGGAPVTLDCHGSAQQVRRLLFAGVAAGAHSVEIRVGGAKNAASSGWYLYFDFLECAVLTDVPDAAETRTDVGVATDYDTDATYKLSPQRLLWNIQKLGLIGEIDHYAGVFWWNQRIRSGGVFPTATVTFGGTWAGGDVAWLHIGMSDIGKSVFPADTPSSIAAHFAYFINATLVGVWASASGPVVTIKTRSTGANWLYDFSVSKTSASGTISVTGSLRTGAAEGTWKIDPGAVEVFTRGFRDWHADWFAALHAAGRGVTVSISQELVNPPDNPPGAVWVQRFPGPDYAPAQTATGFGSLYSSMCAFSAAVQNYLGAAHRAMAGLMATAGLTPRLQFGETLWWYVASAAGMAFYDADTTAAALTALGRPLYTFTAVDNDPAVNAYADANFLRGRLKAYVDGIRAAVLAVYPSAQFELLWPMDVDDPDTRRLLRYVNLPVEWTARAGSGFDTFMVEGFQYGGVDHDVDKAKRCAGFPFTELSWDRAYCRYLMGMYYSGWPWRLEYLAARRTGVPLVKIWAYDHLLLFGWPLPLPKEMRHAAFV